MRMSEAHRDIIEIEGVWERQSEAAFWVWTKSKISLFSASTGHFSVIFRFRPASEGVLLRLPARVSM